jgi:serine/threonine protein kinase
MEGKYRSNIPDITVSETGAPTLNRRYTGNHPFDPLAEPYIITVNAERLNYDGEQFNPGWSGRGIHTYFNSKDEENRELLYDRHLGDGNVAVWCNTMSNGPILIAKKLLKGTRNPQLKKYMTEASHCAVFKHKHVIQFVGTYICADNKFFALLQYPVGTQNLYDFMHYSIYEQDIAGYLGGFFNCLAAGLASIHRDSAKHMDIKPDNIIIVHNQTEPVRDVKVG